MKTARAPFEFVTASYLIRICNQRAVNLKELGQGLDECSDSSIFHHTYHSLERHHFLTQGFSNDFAQWALAALNRHALAERLAALDIREYVSLAELRRDLNRVVKEHCQAYPDSATQPAFEPFYFCESVEVVVPLGVQARTLEEFRRYLSNLSHASLQFHFITSRLRLRLRTNDFSLWFEQGLGLEELAKQTNRIDIYTSTLESVRDTLIRLVDQELAR